MKMVIVATLLALPALSFAATSNVSAEKAASLVRQPGVEKCLSVLENKVRGLAQFESILSLGTVTGESSSTTKYKLTGYNLSGDIMMGSWEIIVTEKSAEEGQTSECTITKNEE